jgi:AAA15 family ATPase/GTPase
MVHISNMQISNFKAFKDSKELDLRKINLIVGKNSAGKSSIIKAILGCSQTAREKKVDSSDFRLVGAHTDLGTFKDAVHGKDETKKFSISFGIKGPEHQYADNDGEPYNFQFTYKYAKGPGLITAIVAGIKVNADGKLLCSTGQAYKNQQEYDSQRLVLSHSKIANLGSSRKEHWGKEKSLVEIPEFVVKLRELIEEQHSKADDIEQLTKELVLLDDFCVDFQLFVNDNDSQFKWKTTGVFHNEKLSHPMMRQAHFASRKLDRTLTDCVYIGPLREEPTRNARLAISSGKTTGKKGEDLAVMLHLELKNKKFRERFNNYLQKLHIANGIVTSESYLDIGTSKKLTGYINVLLEKNGQFNSLVDVGFGTSQVLPVVFELMAQKNRLMLIEQPELHLHPSAQAELGELFNDSIKSGNQLIVETHSVTLIERIRKLIRKGELSNKDVRIIYVQNQERSGSSICKQIGFLSDGDFDTAWPEKDFFGEREAEALSDWW